jgi:hypothetical protein
MIRQTGSFPKNKYLTTSKFWTKNLRKLKKSKKADLQAMKEA